MNLGGGLNEILEVCPVAPWQMNCQIKGKCGSNEFDEPCEEVSQVNELAVLLVLNVDNSPAVLATTDGLAIDDHVAL